ncbi:MAG TPA: acetate/propionate family kinase [Candidatus Deferrimicrobiaceae bacterium]|nr:acetate/propionate family kinase [Candidatus Deferrimicrobiaceae bacterium]
MGAVSVLVLNAGSSTLKFSLFSGRSTTVAADGIVEHPPMDAVPAILASIRGILAADPVEAVGHRVVHGGRAFTGSVPIDDKVIGEIGRLSELAPLHNPPALAAIGAARKAIPNVPQIAVFDTAYFADLPPDRHVYPLPYEWYAERGVRRFGFHGISHAYCAGRAAEFLGRPPEGFRAVTCHLGNGCSATATLGGKAVATTMGFTPLEGLMMGTRAGSVDPGILLHAMERMGLSPQELDEILQHRSGLWGVSGVSSDFRAVQEAAKAGNGRAGLALAIYAHSVRAAIGALAVALGGVDALVFTAGVGENAGGLRQEVGRGLACLGLHLDPDRNRTLRPDADLATEDSPGRILILHTREDLQIAREALRLLRGRTSLSP